MIWGKAGPVLPKHLMVSVSPALCHRFSHFAEDATDRVALQGPQCGVLFDGQIDSNSLF